MRRCLTAAGVAIALAVLLVVPVAAAAASASPSPSAAATVYRIGILEDFDGINPFSAWSGPSWECFRLGYNFLTWYDREYKPVPCLLYTSDAADALLCVDLGGRRIIHSKIYI